MTRRNHIIDSIIFMLFCALLCQCSTVKHVGFQSLLKEMTDRDALAKYPSADYRLAQFSSYDRATEKPGDSAWFANWDRSMFIRKEEHAGRKEYVMFDAKGPGAVVRFWMTFAGENSGKGILRFYLDGQKEPEIMAPATDILSGKALINGILATSVSDITDYYMRGHNLYLPIPYAKSCRITYESDSILDAGAKTGGESVYYNIDYRTYKNSRVKTFKLSDLKSQHGLLDSTQNKLSTRYRGILGSKSRVVSLNQVIKAGRSIELPLTPGPNAVRHINLKLSASNLEQALRSTIIEMKFDGARTVWCPAGDFFGTGYQLRYSNTWYSSVDSSGLLSAWWVMPYQKTASITIHNLNSFDIKTEGAVNTSTWKWDAQSMHFGAGWHQYTNLFTGEMKNNEGGGGPFDINYVELHGKGVYVGDAITLFNTVYAWWGEGDEKVYVDGEQFPSSIGTGTEDYYGYAWCRPEKFSNHPFIAQPDGSGNFNPGYTVNMRFRNLDAIPFANKLKFDMEMWHWTRSYINFAPVSFYYMLPGGSSNLGPDLINAKEKVVLKRAEMISPVMKNGRIEAESMAFLSATGGGFRYQNSVRRGWSDHMQAFWSEGKPGDELKLSFTAEQAGTFEVLARITMAPGYGKYQIDLNGEKTGLIIDAQSERVVLKTVSLGKYDIRAGQNTVTVSLKGTSADQKNNAFGLDYLTVNTAQNEK